MMNTVKKCDVRIGMLVGVMGMVLLGNCAFGQVIRLLDKAVVEPRADVRLGNIATITGTDAQTAEALAETVVLPAVEGSKTLRAEAVLMAVIAQQGAEGTASQLQLSGAASCEITVSDGTTKTVALVAAVPVTSVTPAAPAPTTPVIGNAPAVVDAAEPAVVTASVVNDAGDAAAAPASPTLGEAITARLQKELGLGPADFRVRFDALNTLKDSPAPDGGHWEFRPLTRTFVGTVMWEVEAVNGTRVSHRMTLETTVERREMVLTAAMDLSRGEPVTKESYSVEEAWLDRNLPTLLTDEKDVIGLAAQRDIAAGERLDKRDFKPLLLAQRGDTVTVVFISGSLQVKMTGQAKQDGKMHDSIEVENESTREKYQAELIGKKLAVVGGSLTDAQEKQLREAQ
jgi:flagella basal body P-ring formation protein FlgA